MNRVFIAGYKLIAKRSQKIRVFLLPVLLVLPLFMQAQLSINPLWQDRGFMLRDQLWNLTIINSSAKSLNCTIDVQIVDAMTATPIFSGTAYNTAILPGVNVMSAQKLPQANYVLLSGIYQFNPSYNNLLPAGIFKISYQVYEVGGEDNQMQGEGSFTFESDPLSPPILVLPEHNSTSETGKPFFTWLAPTPGANLLALNYAFKLVAKEQEQSPQEAIERNVSVFTAAHLSGNSLAYTAGMPKLDTGKLYAWQVVAYNDLNYVGASECFLFRLKQEMVYPVNSPGFFIPLSKDDTPNLLTTQQFLKISYNNQPADTSIILRIVPQGTDDSEAKGECTIPVSLVGGLNNITLDLEEHSSIKKDKLYDLYLVNSRKEKWKAAFILNSK